jgi:hypothetical protein
MNRIIYRTDEGGVAVIVPAPEYLKTHTIEELAEKDVPPNTPFEIVDVSEIPEDRTWRAAWSWVD